MDYTLFFNRPFRRLAVFWNEKTKNWVYKRLNSAMEQCQSAPNVEPRAEAQVALLHQMIWANAPTFFANALNADQLNAQNPKDPADDLKLVEDIVARIPSLPLDEVSNALLLDAADSAKHLLLSSPAYINTDYVWLCQALCMYHASRYTQETAMSHDSWRVCHGLFTRDSHDCLAGLYSVIIPLLAQELPAPSQSNSIAVSFYEYIDTTLDQLEKNISLRAAHYVDVAHYVLDIFKTDLEQLAYHSKDETKVRALRTLQLLAYTAELQADYEWYQTELSKTQNSIQPKWRIELAINHLLEKPLPAQVTNVAEYVHLLHHAFKQIGVWERDKRTEANKYLADLLITHVVPHVATFIAGNDMTTMLLILYDMKYDIGADNKLTVIKAILDALRREAHHMEVQNVRRLVNETVQILKAMNSTESFLTLSELYAKGLEYSTSNFDKVSLIARDLGESRTYARLAYKTDSNNAQTCCWLGMLLMQAPTDPDLMEEAMLMFNNVIQMNSPVIDAYVCRGEIYAIKKMYKKAYDDLNHYLTISPSCVTKPSIYQHAKALWLSGMCHYLLNTHSFDELVGNWLKIVHDQTYIEYDDNYGHRNSYVWEFFGINTYPKQVLEKITHDIIQDLLLQVKARISGNPADKRTLELCHLIFLLQDYTSLIGLGDTLICIEHAIRYKYTELLISTRSKALPAELSLKIAHQLYQLSDVELANHKLTRDELKEEIGFSLKQGVATNKAYILCMYMAEAQKNVLDKKIIYNHLAQYCNTANIDTLIGKNYIEYQLLQDMDQSGLLPILKEVADNVCTQKQMADIDIASDTAYYITLYYAYLQRAVLRDNACPPDKFDGHVFIAAQHLTELLNRSNHTSRQVTRIKQQVALLARVVYEKIAKKEYNLEERARLAGQAFVQQNACACFKLANFYLLENPINVSVALSCYYKGREYEKKVIDGSYEYYLIGLLRCNFLEHAAPCVDSQQAALGTSDKRGH